MRPQFKYVLDQILIAGGEAEERFEQVESTIDYDQFLRPVDKSDFQRKTVRFYFEYSWRPALNVADREEWYFQNRTLMAQMLATQLEDRNLHEKPTLYERYEISGGMLPILNLIKDTVRASYLDTSLRGWVNRYLKNENLENQLKDAESYAETYSDLLPEKMRSSNGFLVYANFKEVLLNHYNLVQELKKIHP